MGVVSNTNYYSNAIIGTPHVGANIDIRDASSTPKYQVGFGFERADGARFRYVQVGASNTNRGVVVGPHGVQTEGGAYQPDIDQKVWADTQTTGPNGSTIAPNKLGSTYVWATLANMSDNQLAGSYLVTTDDTGEGYCYRIKSNKATGDVATSVVELELTEPLVEALGTTTDIAIAPCMWANVVAVNQAGAATDTSYACGVTCSGISANNYGWVQTRGVAAVLNGPTAPRQGDRVIVASGVAGSVLPIAQTGPGFASQVVGYCIDPGDSTGHSVIYLQLE